MSPKLVSLTSPMGPGNTMLGPEALLVYIARVSSPRRDKTEDYAGLIRYLIKNKHWSPFEMVSACFEIVTSRAIAAQILRHRSFSFQEFSQRYAEATEVVPVEMRRQAEKNRQSSTDPIADQVVQDRVNQALDAATGAYQDLLDAGVAKECARMVLPLATQTRLYMHGTLRSWIHYLQLRDDEHAQLEHQRIARDIKMILGGHFSITWGALGWN